MGDRAAALEVWVAAYGPKALALTGEVGDGFILQLADLVDRRVDDQGGARRGRGRRSRPRRRHDLRRRARLRHRRHAKPVWPTAATSAAGSAAWSATTSPTSSAATATTAARCPQALTDYIKGRQGYDYNEHGQAGNTHTEFVPDEIVDRFCILGPVERAHRAAAAS